MQAPMLLANGPKLQKMALMPAKMASFSCDIDQTTGLIHFGGGYSGINTYNRTYFWYDIANDAYHLGASLTYNYVQGIGSVVKYNNLFYMEGGRGGAAMATSDTFPLATTTAPNQYTTGDYPAGPGRYAKTSTVIGNKVYFYGGTNASGTLLNVLMCYDFSASSFSTLAVGPVAVNGHEVLAYNGNLYLVGGYNSSTGIQAGVHRYNVSANTWTANFATMPTPTCWNSAAIYKDYLIVGVTIAGIQTFMIYSFLANQWKTKTTGLAQRQCSKLIPDPNVKKGLFMLGGVVGGTIDQLPANDVYFDNYFIPEKWFMF